ncbi:MAG: pantetheine-phosphate adenylyltransferase [Leptospiraceae bacterium]|jgi:pantetheine-phosphate adenylyltransferase|nr:pantetheine-phosphate adenylyltransferase [Leptospiraceae bacterium]MCZ8346726.1 pantetheine-phosphate adenylyltransferase [Leptospiraceae bacterium]PJE03356.1 MAG: pantetheine-phosphate adenylyltransferase [Leptospira sp.]
MNSLAIYPGSFDPLTNGHLDLIKRALQLYDKIIIAVATNSRKNTLFSVNERIDLIRNVTKEWDRIEIDTFDGLTVDYARKRKARIIIRGLRAVTDFDYEYAISLMNSKLAPEVETVFLMANNEHSFISSTIVKEVARHGRAVSNQVPELVNAALLRKYEEGL